ncbi:MAG: Rieske 2Fe-2S domain-containing protein [Jatrophihabitantaceae bacterium]
MPTTDPIASTARSLDGLADKIERSTKLDGLAELVADAVDRLLPKGITRDVASGVPLAHPLHPLIVAVPIGSWTAASWLDLTGGDATAARRLIVLGILSAVPAAATGANDWLTTSGGERRVGLVHALLNDVALALYGASWLARRRGHRGRGAVLSLAGLATTGGAGWLGGHLTFALGVGVDTTAFQKLPADWTDVADESDIPTARTVCADADGVPVLLTRERGAVVALADRCTHRGGPMHEGTLRGGCITCPWHGSTFALDGTVRSGPATRPLTALEVRIVDGRVQVRRAGEPRTLRTNPVGV